jgi:hypothetical protein
MYYTWTSPDGKIHNQIVHILIDRQRHSNILDVQSFEAPNRDADYCLAVNKGRWHRFHMVIFSLKKLNNVECNEKYRVEISNKFAALEDLDIGVEINSAWETITENIKISAKDNLGFYEIKHKPQFVDRC